jgi:hypothetical protein
MKFKIIKKEKNGKERYEVYYFNEFDSRGPKWSQVIWNKEAQLNFVDSNYTNTVEEAEQRAREFLQNHNAEHGAVVREFEII